MAGVEWVGVGVSLIGAGLAYVGARRGTRSEARAVTQSERDEWGRRFSAALELIADDSPRRRALGPALIDALLDSDLAQAGDRRIAESVLTSFVLRGSAATGLPPPSPGAADDVAVVEDTDHG